MLLLFFQGLCFLHAQGENDAWTFSSHPWTGGSNHIIDFSSGTPAIVALPFQHGDYCATVCYPNGQLRFIVDFMGLSVGENTLPKIYHPDGTPVPGTVLSLGPTATDEYYPLIVPHPGNSDRYYLFYSNANALLYSLIDMSLNGGQGGIVPGQKDVMLKGYGTVLPGMMAAVKGCAGVWLVIRSRISNEFYSYSVTQSGLNTVPTLSECGTFPVNYTCGYRQGKLRASPGGKHLVYVGKLTGIELYDFEKCSGRVLNARVLDTTSTPCPFNSSQVYHYSWFHSACFSPDESKLYVTKNTFVDTAIQTPFGGFIPSWLMPGQLFQFDVSQPTLPLIIASKTLVLTNQSSLMETLSGCGEVDNNTLGDMKLAPNGKIYFDNGSYTCYPPGTVPPGFNMAAFHCINQPNLPGLACSVSLNEVIPPGYNVNGYIFLLTGSYLPPDIVTAPAPADTITGQTYQQVVCYTDSILLHANDAGECLHWENGATERDRTVGLPGRYYVSYFKDCAYQTDTYQVRFIRLPVLTANSKSCRGMKMGTLVAQATDTSTLAYVWRMADSSILRQHTGGGGDTLSGLNPGDYLLTISNPEGCDTTLMATVASLPVPTVIATPEEATIKYGDTITLHAAGASLYVWWPTAPLDTTTKADPVARPLVPTTFSVMGIAENGCRDTGYVNINIDFTMPHLVPNAFSPNGDGLNDIFRVEGITNQKVIMFSVFNRYGQEVFHSVTGDKGWDGSQKGKPCDGGTYYYRIELTYPNGDHRVLKGDVLLLR